MNFDHVLNQDIKNYLIDRYNKIVTINKVQNYLENEEKKLHTIYEEKIKKYDFEVNNTVRYLNSILYIFYPSLYKIIL